MSAHDLDAVLESFVRFTTTEAKTWATTLEPKAKRSTMRDARVALGSHFVDGADDTIERLHRPRRPEASWFQTAGSKKVSPRVAFAVQAGTIGGEPVALVYADDYEVSGKGMYNRFIIVEVDGGLKIAARQVRCAECKSAGCGTCSQQGWRHACGRKLNKPAVTATRKIIEPKHAASKAIWDGLG
jgi:hypothetical protein